ncbi:16652_t:CDS:1, partial [Gigaspora rosea]
RTCEAWKKKAEMLKRMAKEYEDKILNETKKQEKYEPTTLDHKCKTWMNKIEMFKQTIKYLYEPKDPKIYKIANKVQDAETYRKDEAQSIRSLPNLKSESQKLKITNNV